MRFAICQELFEGWDWERQCRTIAEIGYSGIEVAPFTLAGSPSDISADRRRALREQAADVGLEICGLHWLLARTQGLHLTSPDAAVRQRTADYLVELGDLCADLGGRVMVFGSPQQRNLAPGVSAEEAFRHAVETFQKALPRIHQRGVWLLIEPLTTKETDFITTCDQGAELIRAVDRPGFGLHQDVKAMLSEGQPLPELIRRHAAMTQHFHANDSNLLGPGMGETDFGPVLEALSKSGYKGWVSVEVFDYSPGAERIARESLDCLKRNLKALA